MLLESPGRALDRLIAERGLLKYRVAEVVGVHPSLLSLYIKERRAVPVSVAERLATLFDVPPSTFLTEDTNA